MTKLRDQILERKLAAENYLANKRITWDTYEKLFHNELVDAVSKNTKSRVFDPKLSTLLLDRSYRVMAQLPTGKVKPISKNDMGTTQLMNLALDKYVIPNANAQFDFLTKLRLVDMYSNIYGNFFAMVDWDVRKNGYVGPDLWLLNIRDVFPQVGAVSLADSDYIIVRTWKPLSYFEGIIKQKGFKNQKAIYDILKGLTGSKDTRDTNSTSKREEKAYPVASASNKAGYFEVLTMYEKDRWVDFSVEADMEFRDIPNPHENGELPVVCKYSIPLLDDFMGMGDMERGMSMQMAINSNWNLYFDGAAISQKPPVLLNKDNIAAESSIQYVAGAKWLGRGQISNFAQPLNLAPQGVQTFNNTYQVANASLLNLFGTSDTTTTSQTDVGFGKTPQALKMQASRENARDSADRFYMEMFLKEVMKKMVNLLSKKQSSAISIRLFGDEIEQLKRSYPDIEQLYDETTGKISIDKKSTGSTLYDYELVSGSTYAVDQQTQQENLQALIELYMKAQTPNGNMLEQALTQGGYNFKFGELMKRSISNSGIQDWDKILEEQTDQEKTDQIINQSKMQFVNAVQQMQGGVNQVPPQPGQPDQGGMPQEQPMIPQEQPMQGGFNG